MTRKLPPLNSLRAFESAGRHRSFTDAAGELHVTPAAIGHQIRALEEHFGQKLFVRTTRKVEMTDAARQALPLLTQGFDLLAEASKRLSPRVTSRILNLTVEPDFAIRWLVHRLGNFQTSHPDWEVRLATSHELVNLVERGFDMGIRYGDGKYQGLNAHKLGHEEVFPVCSPALMSGPHPINTPNDLRWHTLIHEEWIMPMEQAWPSWNMWLKAASADGVNPDRGTRVTNSSLAIEAAIAGHGVALSNTALVADALAKGSLVRPFDVALSTPLHLAYYVVYPEELSRETKIVAFRDWLLDSFAATETLTRSDSG